MTPESILIAGVPLIVIVPACVEVAKRAGLPVRYAGLAAIAFAMALLALQDAVRLTDLPWPTWAIGGVVYGLAAAGFYSQREALANPD
jgi:uncharacterized membrane protein YedE/YeeE